MYAFPQLHYLSSTYCISNFLGRNKEARDAARASLGQPAWTVGKDPKVSRIKWMTLSSYLYRDLPSRIIVVWFIGHGPD